MHGVNVSAIPIDIDDIPRTDRPGPFRSVCVPILRNLRLNRHSTIIDASSFTSSDGVQSVVPDLGAFFTRTVSHPPRGRRSGPDPDSRPLQLRANGPEF
jgi:hypothetical protein